MLPISKRYLYIIIALSSIALASCGDSAVAEKCTTDSLDCAKGGVDYQEAQTLLSQREKISSKVNFSKPQRIFDNEAKDILHYQTTVSITPKKPSENLFIEMPDDAEAQLVSGDKISISYTLLAKDKRELRIAKSGDFHSYNTIRGTTISLDSSKLNCDSLVRKNGSIVKLVGVCIRDVKITLPDGNKRTIVIRSNIHGNGEEYLRTRQ